jgi:hypothetical protein
VNVERDVLDRLEALGIPYYVTGSWASGFYAEPRMTRDMDVVLGISLIDHEQRIRPAFERDFLVNDPVDMGGRWMGGLIHKTEIDRIDLIFGRDDAWARSAMQRRGDVDHPTLGNVWMITPEDLVIAKLEWSQGVSELQVRDVRSIIRLVDDLDWTYLEGQAAQLGLAHRLETVRGG